MAAVEQWGEGAEEDVCLPEKFTVETIDDTVLGASGFTPQNHATDKIVIINGAAATPRHFYAGLACFLSSQGFPAIIYDYRGVGGSAPESLSGYEARLSDWGQKDFPAMLEWVRENFPAHRIAVIGHGVGGQLPAFTPNNHLIDAMVTLSAANDYQGFMKGLPGERRAYFITQVVLPALVRTMGYLPTTRLKLRADLPKNVFCQWSLWRRTPDYFFGDPEMDAPRLAAQLKCPMLAMSFTDDIWAPEGAVRALHDRYINADVSHFNIRPEDFNVKKFGHFGPIAGPGRGRLWADLAQWLDQV